MRKVLKDKIQYFDDGEPKYIDYSIVFVSNRVNREFTELLDRINKLRQVKKEYDDCLAEFGAVINERKEGYKDELKSIIEKKEKLEADMNDKCDKAILSERFEVVKRLLKDNGNKDDRLYDYSFWDEKVEPSEIMSLLYKAVYKDIDGSKPGEAKK